MLHAASAAWAGGASWAQEVESVSGGSVFVNAEAREENRQAVRRGLEFFRDEARRVGSEYQGFHSTPYPVAANSLAGLAMLASGIQPDEGEHADLLLGCLNYLLNVSANSADGFLTEPGSDSASGSRMHGHCYAILFLTQIAGSLRGPQEAQVHSVIRQGVRIIETAQSREGGWYYWKDNRKDEDEASVTICALQALRAARNTGFAVDSARIDAALRYVKRCQKRDGSVCYSLSAREDRTSFSLTAAAVSTLNAAGVYESPELRLGLEYLRRELRANARNPTQAVSKVYFYYGNFYAAQALFQDAGPDWERWYPRVRQRLLKMQTEAGSWESPFGDVYATAMALLILEMPLGYLPIFQR